MLRLEVKLPESLKGFTPGQLSLMTRTVASRVRGAVKEATPVDTSKTKKAWTPVRKGADGSYSFGNPLPQALVLEEGSKLGKRPWPSPGPRTVVNEGRVFSSQAPEGIFAKARVEEIVDRELKKYLGKLL